MPAELDVLAVGCGPFNLGLAALASEVEGLDALVVDQADAFRWHRGMMFDDAMVQTSFLADLVSLVDPTHPLSFLAYLKDVDRMYPFYIRERFHLTRVELEAYLRWAVDRLPNVRFGHRVEQIAWDAAAERFRVSGRTAEGEVQWLARHVVLGIGTEPALPSALADLPPDVCLHTSDYLHRRETVDQVSRITVVGSGQSGAEVFQDLLRNHPTGPQLAWLTRTVTFGPLDYTKLVLEMTTPRYVEYFHALPEERRAALIRQQWHHYKGISSETIESIHELLYQRAVKGTGAPPELRCAVAVEGAEILDGTPVLHCRHLDTDRGFLHQTDLVVAATGYKPRHPFFLEPLEPSLHRDGKGQLVLDFGHAVQTDPAITGDLFVVNADLHSHGVAAPDLGICAWRNARILNRVAGRTVYRVPEATSFTSFAPPGFLPSADPEPRG